MPLQRIPMLTACALALTACSVFAPVEPPPDTLTVSCPTPADLPPRAMTQREVETAWRADRDALTDCGERLALLAAWARAR